MINDDSDFAKMESTGINYDSLKQASISGKSTITRRARTTGIDKQPKKVHSITWNPRCRECYDFKLKNVTR